MPGKLIRLIVATALAVAAFASVLHADALNPREVAADARWYVHLDMAKAIASPLGQAIHEHWTQLPDSRRKIAQIKLITGMNPWTDLKSLTLYGPSGDETEAVAVIHATADPAVVENAIALAQNYNVISHGNHKVHIWTPDDGKHDTMAMCVFNPSTFVLGVSPERVKVAVDAMDKAAAPVGDRASALFEEVPADRWLQMAVLDVSTLPRIKERNEWTQELRHLRMSLGSDDKEAMLTLSGVMSNAEAATRTKTILDGIKAIAVLKTSHAHPALSPQIERLSVQTEGDKVWIDWGCPINELVELIKTHAALRHGGATTTGEKPSLMGPLGHQLDL